MKLSALALLACLLSPALFPTQAPRQKTSTEKKDDPLGLQLPEKENERLEREVQGSWLLFDYNDPEEVLVDDSASGFATFQDGFLVWVLAIETVESHLFRPRDLVLLQTGSYRYRFDQGGSLQVTNVLSYTNMTDSGTVAREPGGQAYEYWARISDGVLELRNSDGVQISFRKVESGNFPESAVRKLEARRGGADHWEVNEGEEPR